MSGLPPREAQIRAQIRDLIRRRPNDDVFALRTEPRWSAETETEIAARAVRIVPCASVLAVREALRDRSDDQILVILTDRDPGELGEDVIARVRRLRPLNPWDAALGLFGARELDPRLASERWLAEVLVQMAPPDGYPKAPTGVLDADRVWQTLLQRRLGLPAEPTLVDLVRWAQEGEHASRLGDEREDVRDAVRRRLADRLGPAAGAILAACEEGHHGDVVAVGLILDALSDPTVGEGDRVAILARIEARLGSDLGKPVRERWGAASARLAQDALERDIGAARRLLAEATEVAGVMRAEAAARASRVLPGGFEGRLRRLASLIAGGAGAPGDVQTALAAVEAHALADREPERIRVATARHAVRLARWCASVEAASWGPASFEEAAIGYAHDVAFADVARRWVRSGDPDEEVAAAWRGLAARADGLRGAIDRAFADLLAGWTAAGGRSESVPGIEALLDDLVGPLAENGPVLVLVADGMSMDVGIELGDAIARAGWRAVVDAERPVAAGLSVLPTVTEVARTSLLSGGLTGGDQGREGRRFKARPSLRDASEGSRPPVLFHRGELSAEGGERLPEAVADALREPRQRVVGIVVNAVDDLLMKGGGLRKDWSLVGLPLVAQILAASADAGRTVVLVSDHGHVLDHGTDYRRPPSGGGERWRSLGGAVAEDEVLLEGPRVLLGDGRIIAAASEWIRYSSSKRDGYHGGATPQEAIVPVGVLVPPGTDAPGGWARGDARVPDWWDDAHVGDEEGRAPAVAERAEATQTSLFEM